LLLGEILKKGRPAPRFCKRRGDGEIPLTRQVRLPEARSGEEGREEEKKPLSPSSKNSGADLVQERRKGTLTLLPRTRKGGKKNFPSRGKRKRVG